MSAPSSPSAAPASASGPSKPSISPRTCGRDRPAVPPSAGSEALARPSRLVFDFSEEYLAQFFHLPQKDAAKLIGVAVITVKRVCKRLGINWPYRAEKLRRLREQRALRRLTVARHRLRDHHLRPRPCQQADKRGKERSEAARRFARLPVECMEENAAADESADESADEDARGRAAGGDVVDAEAILRSLALADWARDSGTPGLRDSMSLGCILEPSHAR